MWMNVLRVGVAGGLGSVTRYLVALWAARLIGIGFPYGTLIVNVAGCFLIAIIAYGASVQAVSPDVRLTLATGFMGGLTTYSSFNLETTQLFQLKNTPAALANIGVTTVGCFLAGLAGFAIARRVWG
jgi:fluoride exporter